MNTNSIKSFAKEARLLLLDGVLQRLKYWGFNEEGSNDQELQSTQGGYIFRGQIYTDTSVPVKWKALKTRLKDKQAVLDVIEEASYTWFNRLMAIKILEANGYLEPTLSFTEGMRTPLIVQNAKKGIHSLRSQADKNLLMEYLQEDKEEQAFGLLIADLCNRNKLLHDIFGRIDDYTEILLSQNLLQKDGVLDLINSNAISSDDYKEVELIGWLYQFYISDKKDEVFAGFKKNKKARAEDIPAATQIFTPKWIVKYMVENTVGKIYLDYEPNSSLRDGMKYLVEAEKRDQGSENRDEQDTELIPNPSSLIPKPSLITDITELTLIDPASGSGHILVAGFELLFKMYREEGYTAKQAVDNILEHNLFGLDIDDRAMQLARFAVLLKAAKYYPEVLIPNPSVPIPKIYSFPADNINDIFTSEYYSRNQSKWNELIGMKLRETVSYKYMDLVIDKKTKEKKEVERTMTFKPGELLTEPVVDLLLTHYFDPIKVDYSKELEMFWGEDRMGYGYSQFFYAIQTLRSGKNIGSALKLELSEAAQNHIKKQYEDWLLKSKRAGLDIEQTSIWNRLHPFLDVLLVLTKKYASVVANPPYMGQKSMNGELKDYVNTHYPVTKSDLMTIFMEVIPNLTADDSRFALINLPSWLFLSSFEKIRQDYIDNFTFDSLLHMGRGIFGIDFGSVAFAIKKTTNKDAIGSYFRLHERNFQHIYYEDIEKLFLFSNNNEAYKYDFAQYRGDEGITEIPKQGTTKGLKLFYPNIPQTNFSKIPGSPIAYWVSGAWMNIFGKKYINDVVEVKAGTVTGSDGYFLRQWFEISFNEISLSGKPFRHYSKYHIFQKGGGPRKYFGNYINIIKLNDFYNENHYNNSIRRGDKDFYFKKGVGWSQIGSGDRTFRIIENSVCGTATPTIYSKGLCSDEYLCGLLNTPISKSLLKLYNPTINLLTSDVGNVPFIFKDDNQIKTLVTENGNISKKDWDSVESSWEFEKSPLINNSVSLSKAYEIWYDQVSEDFFQLHANEEELNRIFIDIYGLQEELTPEVALKDITILQEELDNGQLSMVNDQLIANYKKYLKEKEINNSSININHYVELPIKKYVVISQFISYLIGVMVGRYRLDKTGLNIAHPNPSEQELAPYTLTINHSPFTINIDEDGILPLMGEDCAFPDDALVRTKDLVHAVWGEGSLTENINFIHDALGMDLHKWLTEKFWGYHTSMYKKKPIYWLFSSNVKKPNNAAFKVLVYMHRMDKYTVQKIQRSYLHPHQEYIKREIEKLSDNEENLSKQEIKRLEQLRNWELECRDYNEVLKELANQQIEFDLDDGVSVNYAKFEGAVAKI